MSDRPDRSALGRRGSIALRVLGGLGAAGLLLLHALLPDGSEYADRWPEHSAYMELRERQARAAGRDLRIEYRPVPLPAVSDPLVRAVRVAEDATFWRHRGIDWYEVRGSVREAFREREAPRGASTITMQLARNLYLSPERSAWRKLREIVIARKMEAALTKRRILELYLSVMELGDGIFGVEAAARRYFGIPAAEVGRRRAARLAATIPAPRRSNPATDTRELGWRQELIRRRAFGADTLERAAPRGPISPR